MRKYFHSGTGHPDGMPQLFTFCSTAKINSLIQGGEAKTCCNQEHINILLCVEDTEIANSLAFIFHSNVVLCLWTDWWNERLTERVQKEWFNRYCCILNLKLRVRPTEVIKMLVGCIRVVGGGCPSHCVCVWAGGSFPSQYSMYII